MFVCRGVENHVGPILTHDFFHGCRITYVAKHATEHQIVKIAAEFPIDAVQGVFAVVHHDQLYRVKPGNLPAQFRSDRPSPTRNHHALSGQAITD
jgi:hypothetical protein